MSATNPGRPNDDGYELVEAENPEYWQAVNELGKRGELPESQWPTEPWTPKRKALLGE